MSARETERVVGSNVDKYQRRGVGCTSIRLQYIETHEAIPCVLRAVAVLLRCALSIWRRNAFENSFSLTLPVFSQLVNNQLILCSDSVYV